MMISIAKRVQNPLNATTAYAPPRYPKRERKIGDAFTGWDGNRYVVIDPRDVEKRLLARSSDE